MIVRRCKCGILITIPQWTGKLCPSCERKKEEEK